MSHPYLHGFRSLDSAAVQDNLVAQQDDTATSEQHITFTVVGPAFSNGLPSNV